MLLKHFHRQPHRVVDPLRPGRSVTVGELVPSDTTEFLYHDDDGNLVHAEVDPETGYFTVPHEAAERVRRFRTDGGGWFTPGEVGEKVRLGEARETKDDEAPARPARTRARRES